MDLGPLGNAHHRQERTVGAEVLAPVDGLDEDGGKDQRPQDTQTPGEYSPCEGIGGDARVQLDPRQHVTKGAHTAQGRCSEAEGHNNDDEQPQVLDVAVVEARERLPWF